MCLKRTPPPWLRSSLAHATMLSQPAWLPGEAPPVRQEQRTELELQGTKWPASVVSLWALCSHRHNGENDSRPIDVTLCRGKAPKGQRQHLCGRLCTQHRAWCLHITVSANTCQWLRESVSRNTSEKRWSMIQIFGVTIATTLCDCTPGIRLKDSHVLFHLIQQSPKLGIMLLPMLYRWGDWCCPGRTPDCGRAETWAQRRSTPLPTHFAPSPR